MPTAIEQALVRILRGDGSARTVAGAGWLATPSLCVTCAHVVNAALGRADLGCTDPPPPGAIIRLDQPNRHGTGCGGPPPLSARVLHWAPPGAAADPGAARDTAILALTEPVALPDPPCLLPPGEEPPFDAPGRAYGCPRDRSEGIDLPVTLGGTHAGLRTVRCDRQPGIEAGFSGGPCVDQQGRIVGMTAQRNQRWQVADLLPIACLLAACPALAERCCGASVPTLTLHLRSDGRDLLIRSRHGDRKTALAGLRKRLAAGDLGALHEALFDDDADREAQLFPRPTAASDGDSGADPGTEPGAQPAPDRPRRRLLLYCADADSAFLPWHGLPDGVGRPLGAQGWVLEPIGEPIGTTIGNGIAGPAADDRPEPLPLAQAAILAPGGRALAPDAALHAAQMAQALRALLTDHRAAVELAHDLSDLDASMAHDPELVYVYAQVDRNGNLALGRDDASPQAVPLGDLFERLRRVGGRFPLLWLHCIEAREARLDLGRLYDLSVRHRAPLLILQRSPPHLAGNARRDGLALSRTLAAALRDPAGAVPAAVLGQAPVPGLVAVQSRSGLRLASPCDQSARLRAYIRTALIRLRLGRRKQRNQITAETQGTPDGSVLLFAVGGAADARPFALPEQLRYDQENRQDLRYSVRSAVLPLPATLRPLAPGDDPEGALWDALRTDLRIDALGTHDALMQGQFAVSAGEQLVLILAWQLLLDPALHPDDLGPWLAAWLRVQRAALSREQIPARTRLLVGACLQWPAGWPERHGRSPREIAAQLDAALWQQDAPPHVRRVQDLDPLDLLSENDLLTFFDEFKREADSCARGKDTRALARWTRQHAGGRFEDTVTLIYRGCKEQFGGVADGG